MSHYFSNESIANLIRNVAIGYEVNPEYKKDSTTKYKIIKLNEMADKIMRTDKNIFDYFQDKRHIPLDIQGVGKKTEEYLSELFKTGKVKHYEEIMKGLPQFLFELGKIISPLKAYKILNTYNISSIDELRELITNGKLLQVPGFTEKTVEEIKKELETKPTLFLLPRMLTISSKFKEYIDKDYNVVRSEVAGSIRRKKAVIKDIDIVIETRNLGKTRDYVLKYKDIVKNINQGENWLIFNIIVEGSYTTSVDVRMVTEKSHEYISLLHHLTGSKFHNIHLREIANRMGYTISEHGIASRDKSKIFHPKTEEEFFNYLKFPYIPPELREDSGLELSEEIPKSLVKLGDIKGDLHIHSNFRIQSSHDYGNSSIDKLASKAKELGYEYIGISDHNPKQSLTSKEMIKLLSERKKEIDDASIKYKLKIFNILEVDIRPDGSLAIDDSVLDTLDFVIVSIHSSFDLDMNEMTQRIISGLRHNKAKIFGHPTCRILPDIRKQISVDWNKLFKFCSENNKFIEINAAPPRTDLPYQLVFDALNYNIKFTINSDTHLINQIDNMIYGVYNARKGWCTKENILNSLNVVDFSNMILF